MAKLRWKRDKRPTGLAGVCCGQQGSKLWDGNKEYTRTSFSDGKWNKRGWWFYSGKDCCGYYVNMCRVPVETEKEAKRLAMEYVKYFLQ